MPQRLKDSPPDGDRVSLTPPESGSISAALLAACVDTLERQSGRRLLAAILFFGGNTASVVLAILGVVGMAIAFKGDDAKVQLATVVLYVFFLVANAFAREVQKLVDRRSRDSELCEKLQNKNVLLGHDKEFLEQQCHSLNSQIDTMTAIQSMCNFELQDFISNDLKGNDPVFAWNRKIQSTAISICHNLANYVFECSGVRPYVTVMQSFPSENEEGAYWKMIGYDSPNSQSSPTFNDRYAISDVGQYFIKIACEKDCSRTFVLVDRDAVKAEFSIHAKAESRESAIRQYMGRPVRTEDGSVPFVIQVDVPEICLGETRDAVVKTYSSILSYFAGVLLRAYCQGLILAEQIGR